MIHKEGYKTILISVIIVMAISILSIYYLPSIGYFLTGLLLVFFIFILSFFRYPKRKIPEYNNLLIYAPCDGKVVAIEEVFEAEYFQSKRQLVSIFMSPLNVHFNTAPIAGSVQYKKYHPGKYLVAWHPKSSSENERTSVVIQNTNGQVLVKQIAGAVARRIVNYLSTGQKVIQGEELGFIKFGSRVDLLLPLGARIHVQIDQKVSANKTVIAQFR